MILAFFTFRGITTHPWHPKGPRIWKLAKKKFQLHPWPAEIFGKNRKMRFFVVEKTGQKVNICLKNRSESIALWSGPKSLCSRRLFECPLAVQSASPQLWKVFSSSSFIIARRPKEFYTWWQVILSQCFFFYNKLYKLQFTILLEIAATEPSYPSPVGMGRIFQIG